MAARKGYRATPAAAADEPADGDPRSTRRRIAAVVAAAGGWYTTWLFITAIGITGIPGFAVSIIIEWLLFEFKREVLAAGAQLTVGGVIAVVADTVLNGGGMWSVVLGLNNTDTYDMFHKALELGPKPLATAAAGGAVAVAGGAVAAAGSMPMLPALGIALALGFILSIAPHKLWHRR
jgi:hypothetical protein